MLPKFILGVAIVISPSLFFSCVYDEINKIDCTTLDLAISGQVVDVTSCSTPDGSIRVFATGGKPFYAFSKDGINFFGSNTFDLTSFLFNNLTAGTYTLTVKDENGCTKTVEATVGGSDVTATVTINTDSGCNGTEGEFTINPTGGISPYTYQLGSAAFGASGSFTSLTAGTYQATVKDAEDCQFTITGIKVITGVSFQNDIKPILETNCIKSGCHNGDNGAERNWSIFTNVKAKAAGIKTKTGNKSMPKDIAPTGLPQSQIDLIACWVDDGALNN